MEKKEDKGNTKSMIKLNFEEIGSREEMQRYLADKLSIPYAVFLGEDEVNAGKVTVKDLSSGAQQTLSPAEAVLLIQTGLTARQGGTPILEPEGTNQ